MGGTTDAPQNLPTSLETIIADESNTCFDRVPYNKRGATGVIPLVCNVVQRMDVGLSLYVAKRVIPSPLETRRVGLTLPPN